MQLVLLIYYIALTSKTKLNIFTYYYLKNICNFRGLKYIQIKYLFRVNLPLKPQQHLMSGIQLKIETILKVMLIKSGYTLYLGIYLIAKRIAG